MQRAVVLISRFEPQVSGDFVGQHLSVGGVVELLGGNVGAAIFGVHFNYCSGRRLSGRFSVKPSRRFWFMLSAGLLIVVVLDVYSLDEAARP